MNLWVFKDMEDEFQTFNSFRSGIGPKSYVLYVCYCTYVLWKLFLKLRTQMESTPQLMRSKQLLFWLLLNNESWWVGDEMGDDNVHLVIVLHWKIQFNQSRLWDLKSECSFKLSPSLQLSSYSTLHQWVFGKGCPTKIIYEVQGNLWWKKNVHLNKETKHFEADATSFFYWHPQLQWSLGLYIPIACIINRENYCAHMLTSFTPKKDNISYNPNYKL